MFVDPTGRDAYLPGFDAFGDMQEHKDLVRAVKVVGATVACYYAAQAAALVVGEGGPTAPALAAGFAIYCYLRATNAVSEPF